MATSGRSNEICVKTAEDKKNCWITGMTLLIPDNLLVLADYDNKSVKMVDTNSKQIASEVILPSFPYDITSVTSTKVAVTVPSKQAIQYVAISSVNRLTLSHSLKVDGQCKGIHCYQQKLVVTYAAPCKLQILDMEGRVLTDVGGENIVHKPCYVSANRGAIFVSNLKLGKSSVMTLNWQGEVTGEFEGLMYSADLALKNDGTVFVCDSFPNNIQHISGDCTNGKVVLRYLNSPRAVCWSDERRTLYISSSATTEECANFLQVYKIQMPTIARLNKEHY